MLLDEEEVETTAVMRFSQHDIVGVCVCRTTGKAKGTTQDGSEVRSVASVQPVVEHAFTSTTQRERELAVVSQRKVSRRARSQ
jgi:hypothetical protein